jgi:hypothetical protein
MPVRTDIFLHRPRRRIVWPMGAEIRNYLAHALAGRFWKCWNSLLRCCATQEPRLLKARLLRLRSKRDLVPWPRWIRCLRNAFRRCLDRQYNPLGSVRAFAWTALIVRGTLMLSKTQPNRRRSTEHATRQRKPLTVRSEVLTKNRRLYSTQIRDTQGVLRTNAWFPNVRDTDE